jgi:exodeoxyribonuclease III
MKIVSWNVNGIRACVNKGFLEFFNEVDADIFCIQESKCQHGQIELPLEGYEQYWNYAIKKGYSGTAIFTKTEPISVSYGLGEKESEDEGRIITLEFEKYYVVNVYTPNAKRTLERLEERLEWEDEIREYLIHLNRTKPVIYCGDLNVAHQEIDLKNAKTNKGNSGFTEEERGKMTDLLSAGFIDSYRYLYPSKEGAYSWWSYMSKVRERNIGWRIDYVIVSDNIKEAIIDANIHSSILGSDHCPVSLEIDEEKILAK